MNTCFHCKEVIHKSTEEPDGRRFFHAKCYPLWEKLRRDYGKD